MIGNINLVWLTGKQQKEPELEKPNSNAQSLQLWTFDRAHMWRSLLWISEQKVQVSNQAVFQLTRWKLSQHLGATFQTFRLGRLHGSGCDPETAAFPCRAQQGFETDTYRALISCSEQSRSDVGQLQVKTVVSGCDIKTETGSLMKSVEDLTLTQLNFTYLQHKTKNNLHQSILNINVIFYASK